MSGGKKEIYEEKMGKKQDAKIVHCCKNMEYFLNEKKVLIFYNPIFREYFIGLRSYKDGKHAIYYCPWCGKQFSPSLIDTYITILSDKYDISFDVPTGKYFDISSNEFDFPRETESTPEEFKTDEWWKKRNL